MTPEEIQQQAVEGADRIAREVARESRKHRWLCWFWHKWSSWTVIGRGDLVSWNNTLKKETLRGRYIEQERICERCGKRELNDQRC